MGGSRGAQPPGGRPIVAVVPFGARGTTPRAGAWARQIARRLVERFARDDAIELRPVFLVAMPEAATDASYLVFGSSPEAELAASYGASLGATHALSGTYQEDERGRRIEATLVDVETRAAIATATFDIGEGELQDVEPALASWIVTTCGVIAAGAIGVPAAANEPAYAALLEGMDEEVTETLLRQSDPAGSDDALVRALERYVGALRADPECIAAEERLLVLAAESLEHGGIGHHIRALEEATLLRPRSWRAHYVLGQLRAEAGDTNGAIVAFEHAHGVRPLPDTDVVRVAELYANAGAVSTALAHVRRIGESSEAYAAAQELVAIVSFQRGDVATGQGAYDRAIAKGAKGWELHASFAAALHARGALVDAAHRYTDALAEGGPAVVRLNLARVLLTTGEQDRAARELETLLATEKTGEIAATGRRLRFGIAHPDLERELERAGNVAASGDATGLDTAQASFERALAAEPDLWEAHFGLGLIARHRGDAAAAVGSLRRVLELWPDQPDALHELGVALLMSNDTGEALRSLELAAALRPRDAGYLADAGFAQLRAGNLDAARERLEHARLLDEKDPITRAYLSELERVQTAAGKPS